MARTPNPAPIHCDTPPTNERKITPPRSFRTRWPQGLSEGGRGEARSLNSSSRPVIDAGRTPFRARPPPTATYRPAPGGIAGSSRLLPSSGSSFTEDAAAGRQRPPSPHPPDHKEPKQRSSGPEGGAPNDQFPFPFPRLAGPVASAPEACLPMKPSDLPPPLGAGACFGLPPHLLDN